MFELVTISSLSDSLPLIRSGDPLGPPLFSDFNLGFSIWDFSSVPIPSHDHIELHQIRKPTRHREDIQSCRADERIKRPIG